MSEASQKSDLLIGAFSLNITCVSVWISSLFKVTPHLLFIPVLPRCCLPWKGQKYARFHVCSKGLGKWWGHKDRVASLDSAHIKLMYLKHSQNPRFKRICELSTSDLLHHSFMLCKLSSNFSCWELQFRPDFMDRAPDLLLLDSVPRVELI